MTAIAPRIAAQTVYQAPNPNEYLFPGLCVKQNGDFLMMARKAPGHLIPPGTVVARTSSTGLAGSWSTEALVFAPPGGRNAAAGIPRLMADGRIAVMAWYDDSDASPPYVTTTLISTDATATSWVRGGDIPDPFGVGAQGGNACESPIVFMPDGSWLLPTYACEADAQATGSSTTTWSSILWRSTDQGATWAFKAYVARASVATGVRPGTAAYEEPFLLRLQNGDLICAVRVSEPGWTDTSGRYTHIYRSTDDGATWTDEGRPTAAFNTASRMALHQTPGGTVTLHHRLLTSSGLSGRGAYQFSSDNAHTWSGLVELDSGSVPSSPNAPPMYSYGDTATITGGVAMLWADETPISGSGPAIQFKTYDVTGEPTNPLVIGSSSDWVQVGTGITVNCAVGIRSTVPATAYTAGGGLLRFTGTHASRFFASTDGSTWSSTLTLPPGTSSIFLSVLPQTGDTTLNANVGVPV